MVKKATIRQFFNEMKDMTKNLHQNPQILAKDRHMVMRLERELRGNFPDDIKAKKRTQFDQIMERSALAVQARMDSVPSDLADRLNADLPVTARADEIIRAIQDNQVIIVAGETGSGKTTQLPKLAMLAGRGTTGQIGHTQPRTGCTQCRHADC